MSERNAKLKAALREKDQRIAELESGEWERWLLDTSIEQAERAQRAEERLDAELIRAKGYMSKAARRRFEAMESSDE